MFKKKILALSLFGIASVGAFPPRDALVKLTAGPHLAEYLIDLQEKFVAEGVSFEFKPRANQFHITLNYIKDAYDPESRNAYDSVVLSECVIGGVLRTEIEEVKDMEIGEAELMGDYLVVKVVGAGAVQLKELHNSVFSGLRRPVSPDTREYIPHISLGIIEDTNKEKAKKALKSVSVKRMKFSNKRYVFSFYAARNGELHEVTGFFGPHKRAWNLFGIIKEIEGVDKIEGI